MRRDGRNGHPWQPPTSGRMRLHVLAGGLGDRPPAQLGASPDGDRTTPARGFRGGIPINRPRVGARTQTEVRSMLFIWLLLKVVGVEFGFTFPPLNMLIALVGTVVLALLVIRIPLRRAVRFKPGEAIRYA